MSRSQVEILLPQLKIIKEGAYFQDFLIHAYSIDSRLGWWQTQTPKSVFPKLLSTWASLFYLLVFTNCSEIFWCIGDKLQSNF